MRTKLVDSIVENILNEIASGRFKPGDKLPTQQELTNTLSVGRNTLREALTRLESMGVLQIRHGQGMFVSRMDVRSVFDKVLPLLVIEHRNLTHLVEARKAIEVQATGIAAERSTKQDIAKLTEIVKGMSAALQDPAQFTELDFEFHDAIAHAGGNPLFPRFLSVIREALKKQQRLIANDPQLREISLGYHREICEAIVSHRPEEAMSKMSEHLDNILLRFAVEGMDNEVQEQR
jgi:GntR family transcriptional repressor for pyruvate dehydrogenase complex